MTNRPNKTKPIRPEYITRRELVIFANAVDARIAQEIGKLRDELTKQPTEPTDEEIDAVLQTHPIFGPAMRGEVTGYTVAGAQQETTTVTMSTHATVPTDSEGAE